MTHRGYARKPPTFTPEEIIEVADLSGRPFLDLVDMAKYHPYMLRDLQIEYVGITPFLAANRLLERIPIISTVVKIGKAITKFKNDRRARK